MYRFILTTKVSENSAVGVSTVVLEFPDRESSEDAISRIRDRDGVSYLITRLY